MRTKPPTKLKVVVSDFHIGDGKHQPDGSINIGEDFHHDEEFIGLLQHYMDLYPRGGDVELIINGDFFNFIFVAYRGTRPVHITPEISLEKLKNIMDAHPRLFDHLSQFGKKKGFRISYLIGNHDTDMVWPECQAYLNKRLGCDIKVYPLSYEFDGIHIEHGNRFELFNRFDVNQPILHENGFTYLNLPFGSFFVFFYVAPLKVEKPQVDRIKPFRVFLLLDLLMHFPSAVKDWCKLFLFFMYMLFNPYKRRFPSIRNTFQIMLAGMSVYPNLDRNAKTLLRANKNIHTVIFGHTHVSKVLEFREHKRYINSGTWNEITTLDLSQFGRRENKTFVEIAYQNSKSKPECHLKVWHGTWRPVSTFQ